MKNFVAGHFIDAGGYNAFHPEYINRIFEPDDPQLLGIVEEASLRLGELKAFSELVPDVNQFIRLHVIKEATLSSRIEGTQTRMEEALLKEEEVAPERRNDWREVNNYIEAMNHCIDKLPAIPLSSRLMKSAHRILLMNARGEHKMPGEYRKSQNWIGGASLRDAVFIPPVAYEVDKLMGDLENFLHNPSTNLPHVLKIALAHYQFETIHPFLDGNGRIGRLMITLYFIQAGILRRPVLYLSDFFDRHRNLYYQNLMKVRTENNLSLWMRFFLHGIIETSEKSTGGLRKILALKNDCEMNRLPRFGRKMHSAQKVMQYLFQNPVIRPEEIFRITGLSAVSGYKLLDDFEAQNILTEITGNQRNRIFVFSEYIRIFDDVAAERKEDSTSK
jgi:Fic family protein